MKTQRLIKLLFVSLLLVACKKENKEMTTVNFHIHNPISGEGMQGVTVKVVKAEDVSSNFQLSNDYDYQVIWEGKTDVSGKASYTFSTLKKDKYTYWQVVGENTIQAGGKKILSRPDYGPLKKQQTNKIEYTYTVPASFIGHYKNVNCTGENNRFRFRFKRMYNTTSFGWSNWSQDQFDCYELIYTYNGAYEDYLIYEYEVERNSITNTYLDTFYINPYSIDTLKIFY